MTADREAMRSELASLLGELVAHHVWAFGYGSKIARRARTVGVGL